MAQWKWQLASEEIYGVVDEDGTELTLGFA
jgi:hypothetical protein